MSMSDKNTSNFSFIFFQIRNIWNNIICTKFFISGKFHSSIHDDDVVFIFNKHTLSHLFQTYKITNFYRYFIFFDKFFEIFYSHKRWYLFLTNKRFRSHFWPLRIKRFFASIRSFRVVFFGKINRKISLHGCSWCRW